ncbi:MAG: hypothetical protein J0M17_09600 [Planctomycetes bacterium]|nr:hypothetical protein [Planctomycetota bacterium]
MLNWIVMPKRQCPAVGGLLALVLLTGCTSLCRPRAASLATQQHSPRQTSRVDNNDAMLAAVRTLVPPGTSLTQAEEILQAEGFDCTFADDDPTVGDCLRCTRVDSTGPLVSRRWTVRLPYRDGMVVDIRVESGLVGP